MNSVDGASADLAQIIESARRLGVEMDEAEAIQWLTAMAAGPVQETVAVDEERGVFGHVFSLLDFDPAELAYYRRMGRLAEFADEPGVVETALALSGSAAQSKIQTYPGDCDFFERINILAPTRQEACAILSRLMRMKALSTLSDVTHRLIEVKFGSYPEEIAVDGRWHRKGAPIAWLPRAIKDGAIKGNRADGTPITLRWDDVAREPGWCKLDWIVADPVHQRLANVSNMIDATWEAADGTIRPLDGYLDPYYQEVYLEAESIPLFSKVVKQLSSDALDHYVAQMEEQVRLYVTKDPRNYGKAAKRLYNLFRLTGRYAEAAFLRELFDEPATALYQVWSLLRTMDEAAAPGAQIDRDVLLAQMDRMVLDVVSSLDGGSEREIVASILRLRNIIAGQGTCDLRTAEAEAASTQVMNEVNTYFYARLVVVPAIRRYLDLPAHTLQPWKGEAAP